MNVLTFTTLYPNNIWPNHGVFVKERMTRFARLHGCHLKVVAPVPYFPPFKLGWRYRLTQVAQHELIEGIEVYHPRYLMTPKVGMAFYGLLMFFSVLPTLTRISKTFEFDVIDAHYVYPDGFAALLLGQLLRKPVVVSARGTDINLFPKFPLVRPLIQYTLNKSDKAIAVCTALKQSMAELGIPENKISVIPNGVDCEKFYQISKHEARHQLGLPSTKQMILSVGGLIPRKSFDVLFNAFKILSEEYGHDNIRLVVVGEGEARAQLEKLISSLRLDGKVSLVGSVPHRQLLLWYNAADLFCLAGSREGWPNVLMESLACGTPVVATDVWGVPEIIASEDMGLLTNRDAKQMAHTMSLALRRKWQPERLIRFAKQHTWDQVAHSLNALFKAVLDARCV